MPRIEAAEELACFAQELHSSEVSRNSYRHDIEQKNDKELFCD